MCNFTLIGIRYRHRYHRDYHIIFLSLYPLFRFISFLFLLEMKKNFILFHFMSFSSYRLFVLIHNINFNFATLTLPGDGEEISKNHLKWQKNLAERFTCDCFVRFLFFIYFMYSTRCVLLTHSRWGSFSENEI